MGLKFIDKQSEKRFKNMFDINKIRDVLDDEEAPTKKRFAALKRDQIWVESEEEMWRERMKQDE